MNTFTKETERIYSTPAINEYDRCHVSMESPERFLVKFFQLGRWTENEVTAPSYKVREFISRFPEKKSIFNRVSMADTYSMPATDIVVQLLLAWPSNQIKFSDEAKIVVDYQKTLLHAQEMTAKITADFKLDGRLPKNNLEVHPTHTLSDYQKVALINSFLSPSYALFMEQGTGKTAVAVARICNAAKKKKLETGKPYRVLVTCPKNVRVNWEREIAKFATCSGRTMVVRGNQVDRMKCFIDAMRTEEKDCFTVVICSYENLSNTWEMIQTVGKAAGWDLSVLDEVHFIKSSATKRWKFAKQLRSLAASKLILTGTPITQSALDLWTQFEYLYEGGSGFVSQKEFNSFYGQYEPAGGGYEKLVGIQNVPFLKERLARCTFMITKKEAMPYLPDKVFDEVEVEMTTVQKKMYTDLATKLCAQAEEMLDKAGEGSKKAITANHILTMMLRLAQICSGHVRWDGDLDENGEPIDDRPVEQIPGENPKVEELVSILKEKTELEKTLVWTCFREDTRVISERLTAEGIDHVVYDGSTSDEDREKAQYRFNNVDSCKVFIGNAKAGGTGLNLLGYDPNSDNPSECNANHVIYFSQNWSANDRLQSEDRAHRRGSREPVRITDLVVPNTIDEEIRKRVEAKRNHALEVSDIRQVLSNVRELMGKL
jgi:SNF2 family DNA or RNA helicase